MYFSSLNEGFFNKKVAFFSLHILHRESYQLGLFVFPKVALDALELLLEQASIISGGIAFYPCYQGGTVNVVEGDDVYLGALHLYQILVGQDEAKPKAEEAILYAPTHIATAWFAKNRLELANIIIILIQVLQINVMVIKLICIKLIANVRCFSDNAVGARQLLYFFNRFSYLLSFFCLTFADQISRSRRMDTKNSRLERKPLYKNSYG